jgi:hypothetical protein
MRILFALLALAGTLASAPLNTLTPREQKEGYILMFNGKNLDGWDGDPKFWSVQDGVIVGSSDSGSPSHNTFLIYKQEYSDFILQFDIKLHNGNSGMQFRSKRLPDWVVTGYQADASEAGDRSAWGNFYEEKGRGRNIMKTPDQGWLIGKKVVHTGGWNHYEVFAKGDHFILKLNGVTTIDLHDDKASTGVIAVQLHQGPPMKVELRNLKIKPLP